MAHKAIAVNVAATPLMKQYWEIKGQYNDAILFFRLGDFYEMFFDDAILASKLLDITLTSRNKHDDDPVPLCGVPYHAVEPYIAKLLENGRKIAICEQIEDPKTAKGVVRRAVTKIYTPGVVPEGAVLDDASSNFVAAVWWQGGGGGIAFADISTGHFAAAAVDTEETLIEELTKREPREILIPRSGNTTSTIYGRIGQHLHSAIISPLDDESFCTDAIDSLEGGRSLGLSSEPAGRAAGAVYRYLAYTQRGNATSIDRVERYLPGECMRLDESTKRNLEILRTVQTNESRGSFWWLMNRTQTSMGARLLKEWLCYPSTSPARINERLDAVATLVDTGSVREGVAAALRDIGDLERLTTRMSMGTGNARDVCAIAQALERAATLKGHLEGTQGLLGQIREDIDTLDDLRHLITQRIVDDPPLSVREGGMIRDGVHPELDELRSIRREGKQHLARMEGEERNRTGIGSLKVRYNKVFGYYIEVTNTHRDKVPSHYIRKQTLTNAERYITQELKEFEDKVLGAEDRIKALEYELFGELKEECSRHLEATRRTARAIARCDIVLSFARLALENRYCRPQIVSDDVIEIEEGRHPVVERIQRQERFVPNDVRLGGEAPRFMMITGPNMSGKSTAMRQTALIVLMAQVGSFVPAARARIGIVDRIFTRIGASDALARGQSTFMVEMMEASTIIREATPRSLIVIDEIGRGTSTFDGLAIAWAIAEELHDRVRARTLFATHYHELTELAVTRPAIANYQIAVKEWNDRIIFLRRLVPGGTSHSYGIEVARLAGLTPSVIARAKEILANLEKGEFDEIGRPRIARKTGENIPPGAQIPLFTASPLIDELRETDLTTLTPLEALNLLHRWKQSM